MKMKLSKEEQKSLAEQLRQTGSLPYAVAKKLAANRKKYKKKSI